jgi:hypothetical protein
VVCSLSSCRRRWKVAAQAVGMVAVKPWAWTRRRPPLSEGARRGLGASVRTGSPTGGSRVVFYFSNLSKTGSTVKVQNGCLILLQKFPILHAASLGYCEQFFQLCRHPIPNINRAENPRSNSTFESLINLKGIQTFWKNLINSPKFLLDLIFTKVNSVGITYMREFELQYKCQTTWFE